MDSAMSLYYVYCFLLHNTIKPMDARYLIKSQNILILLNRMKHTDVLNLNMVNLLAESPESFYIDNDIYVALSARAFGQKNMRIGQPYRVEEGRLVIVTSGWSKIIANLEEYELHIGMAFVLPPDSILEIVEYSDDLDMRAVTFKDLLPSAGFSHAVCMQLTEKDVIDIDNLLMLLWQEVHRSPKHREIIHHIEAALFLSVKRLEQQKKASFKVTASHQEQLHHRFVILVKQHGLTEHKVEFYADRLCITPNYLSSIIRRYSGLTVMQWINRHVIQQAKLQLKYSDLPVWQIAETLNFPNPSFFCKFFKHETGMSPGEYRNSARQS